MSIKNATTVAVKQLLCSPLICDFSNVAVNQDQFVFFVKQKAALTQHFVDLLKIMIELVKPLRNDLLLSVLTDNLHDEMGYDAQGIQYDCLSHTTFRRQFHQALGASAAPLDSTVLRSKYHHDQFYDHLTDFHPLEVMGVFLMLERWVPLEYRSLKTSRDVLFAEVFVDHPEDSISQARAKHDARHYIDDHIVHDAMHHFPNLLKSLEIYQDSQEGMTHIVNGINRFAGLRSAFYQDVVHSCGLRAAAH